MGFYSKYLFPLFVDWVLGQPQITELRRSLLAEVKGRVLEIGFGTGLNLACYPSAIREITVVDPNPGMQRRARRRLDSSEVRVHPHLLKGESLPFPDSSFESIVTTFTLCSIGDPSQALAEIRRVLKGDGRFFLLEHGLSPEDAVQRWQRRLTPLQRKLGDGCHLDREMESLVTEAGFEFKSLKMFYHPSFPKIAGYFYQGIAAKSKSPGNFDAGKRKGSFLRPILKF